MAKTLFIISSLIFLSLHFPFIQSSSSNPDFQALMAFKTASDKTNHLTNWNKTTHPCSWYGVSCLQNRVSRLVLEGLNLHGSFETLTSLNQLRLLSLKRNHLSGPIPDLSNFTALKLLFLSHNQFSGEFPPSLPFLLRLYRLDLSYNNLSGQIPANVNHLSHLLTLRLEENQFSGPISRLNIPNLQDFNVSRNHLSGEIPKSLSGFPETAFGGNLVLCGPPLASCKDVVSDPSKPGSDGALASPVTPVTGSPAMVASSPSSIPEVSQSTTTPSSNARRTKGSKLSVLAVVAIIIGDILVLALISGILFCYFWKTNKMAGNRKRSSQLRETEKIVYSSSPYTSQGGILERGKMVFFEEHHQKRFELEDLLRASAEMLGKGGFGTAYKAILDDGNVVAVKRLKETNLSAAAAGGGVNNEIKRIFDQHMEILGRLRHPNLVSLMAYYYGRDEKLLVYEYMPNGSLFWLLHGNRGPGRTPLDWTTRLKIASGAARGLAFLHHHSSNRTASSSSQTTKLIHGNIKSTNVLIDKSGNTRVSDFGLSVFASPTTSAVPRSNGYRAPEALDGRKLTEKSDVYAFGVLLLEMLTGKCPLGTVENNGGGVLMVDLPRWVQSVVREEWTAEVFDLELMRYKDIEEEMVGLLQIAMACTSTAPDQRPKMGYVVKMIDEIRGVEEVSPSHESSVDSVSNSPSVSDGTGVV